MKGGLLSIILKSRHRLSQGGLTNRKSTQPSNFKKIYNKDFGGNLKPSYTL